ncbi:sugar ABC transporter substrate-binding protein [Bacillus sp. 03113]|uniref:sugar ABC transporter substrate-binding protein n=1 Tax=Bacillus sp. 03113 TaxID=2578211 RepID=UPI0015E88156|nr:sugar ABC transporter substrate-binding protein [Bacillus sp. 03113]
MKKQWVILTICTVFLSIFLGYGLIGIKADKPKIIVILKNSEGQYWKFMIAGFEKGFNDFGVEGKVLPPDKKDPDQLRLLKNALKEKPDALIYSPDSDKSIPALEQFKKNNIPVLLVDAQVDWSDQTSFIGTDNIILGKKAGELLTTILQPADKVALIGRESANTISKERVQGAKEALLNAGINSVEAYLPFGGENSNIKNTISTLLKNHPDLQGVFATDDGLALEALEFINNQGLRMPVIGSDGVTEMVKKIENGTIKSSVAQNPYDMGYISVENALKAIKGKKVEKHINSGVDIITVDNAKDKLTFLENILQ